MTRFFYAREIKKPKDVIRHLAKGEHHWRKGYSAYELAHSWVNAAGIPAAVGATLDTCPAYRGAELVEGLFEREVNLRTRGRRSQTDLLALLHASGGPTVLAVEGKVDEPFGPLVAEWRDGSPGRERRLASLCDALGLELQNVGRLRYQLFHRSVSAVFEAQRYRCRSALMLVHSFSPARTSFSDFAAFASEFGTPVTAPGQISGAKVCAGIELRLGWVADMPAI